jgi:gliding motility-associated-like protein
MLQYMYFCYHMMKNGLLFLNFLLITSAGYSQQPVLDRKKPQYEFVQNKGQFHPLVRYQSRIPFGNLYLEGGGFVYDMMNSEDYNRIQEWKHHNPATPNLEVPQRHAIRFRFKDVVYAPKSLQRNIQSHYYNYILGSNQQKWVSKIHPAGEIVYQNVYPGIDFEISGQQDIKYQWVIHNPTTANVLKIKTVIEGANNIVVDNQQLKVYTDVGILTDDVPFAYQIIDGNIQEIRCQYVLQDSILGYELLDDVNPEFALVIDPKLIFSTYSGSVGDNFGFTATYDSKGNLYAGGIVVVKPSMVYPVTAGAYDETWNGGSGRNPANLSCDIAISKYDSAGNNLLWATYLGGEDDEYPHSLVVDRNDDLVLLGTSYSDSFPYLENSYDTIKGLVKGSGAHTDIIVSKLSEDGTTLLGSTYIGGNRNDGLNLNSSLKNFYADDYRGDVITDDDGNIFVASVTQSDSMPLENEIQNIKNGNFDGYLFELSPDCSELIWGTFLGGSSNDAFYSIKLDQHNNIFIGGGSNSSNLPTTDSVLSKSKAGDIDGVIGKFNKTTKSLEALTYWGTSSYDQIYFIDVDAQNRIYATGQTEGAISQTPGTYGESNKGQFIFRIDSSLRSLDFKTTFGIDDGIPNLAPSAFLVDVCDHIYFSGWGSTDYGLSSGSTRDLEVTSDAEQPTTDSNDFYILVLDKDASSLLYATYFGGNLTGDHVDGGTSRFDKKGVIYQSVCSSCPPSRDGLQTSEISDFPTSPGAVFKTNPSERCSNASFKIDLQIKTAVIADFTAKPTLGCSPLVVQFNNKSILGDSMIWEFGDGDTSTLLNPIHTYITPGDYIVRLTVIDSNTCNISSVYERQITVIANSNTDFEVEYDACTGLINITNNSTNAFTYRWDFGDGGSSSKEIPDYQYSTFGDYKIKLFVNEGQPCESSDSLDISIINVAEADLKLYNVFTPNNDNLNDCFQMEGISIECSEYRLEIYNRWGEKVFETNDPNDCWNGRVDNTKQELPSSTYFYILYIGKNSLNLETYSGSVELIRE